MAVKALNIELVLESKEFSAAMQKVNDAFENTNKDLQKFGKNLQKIGAGAGSAGAAITAALGVSMKSLANAADVADDTAKRTGLTAQAVQELAYVAKMAGADLGAVETALRAMQRNLADTGAESAAFTGALETLGLRLEDLRQMGPQQQFDTLSAALAGVEDASQRAGLAMAVFGRSGTAVLPMLAEGADGIARLKQEAHDYGFVMSDEVVNAGNTFNDNLDRLKGSAIGLAQQFASGLLPAVNRLMLALADVTAGVKNWMGEHPKLTKTLAALTAGIGAALAAAGGLAAAFGTFIALAPALGAAVTAATGPVGIITAAIAGLVSAIIVLYQNWDTVSHYLAQAWDALTVVVLNAVKMQLSALENLVGWVPGLGEVLRTAIYKVQDAAAQAAFDIGQRQLEYEKEKNAQILAGTENLVTKQQEIVSSALDGQINTNEEKTTEAAENTLQQISDFWQSVYDTSLAQNFDLSKGIADVYASLSENLSDAFYSMFQQIGNGWEGLKNIAVNLCKSIYNSFVSMLADIAAEQIKNLIAVQVANATAAKANVAANAAEAGSKAAAASAGWALFGAVAIGAAIMAAVLAFADGFTTGGIVPGNSFSGDHVLARVNSGEMILNGAQQARLFDIANGDAGGQNGGQGAVINQTINVGGGTDLSAITQAIKRGTVQALEFANVAYKAGQKRNKYVG